MEAAEQEASEEEQVAEEAGGCWRQRLRWGGVAKEETEEEEVKLDGGHAVDAAEAGCDRSGDGDGSI